MDINHASGSITREVGLDLKGLHILPEDIVTFKVTLHIGPIQGTRRVTHIPVLLEATEAGVLWHPKIVNAILHGPVLRLRDINVADIQVKISVKGLLPGIHLVEPKCVVPKGFTLLELIPKEIKVTVPE